MLETTVNIASHLPKMAELQPYTRAVVFPEGRDKKGRVTYAHLTYKQLNEETDKYARGFEEIGITKGVKTILMVKPSIEFFAVTFSLFKVGAIPVLIDPGMGIKRLVHCLGETQAEAFIGLPVAHMLRMANPKHFRSVRTFVTVGKKRFWKGHELKTFRCRKWEPYKIADVEPNDTAAILFTTGSTGPAKGAVYEHRIFDAQIRYLKARFNIQPGEIDLPTFSLFGLFAPALGMTAIVPDMNPTKPAEVNPVKIIEAIHNQGVTNMFGSPALINRVGRYCEEHDIKLPSLRRVLSAGAPVAFDNLARFRKTLCDEAEIYTPYGATEALPIAAIGSKEILGETSKKTQEGHGICVGVPLEELTLKIIKISDDPIPEWNDDLVLPDGEKGEIVIQGDIVTRAYYQKEEATQKAKIYEKDGKFWHRMGDIGWLDEQGRLWFCGRKAHRVVTEEETLFTVPCEGIFQKHPQVYRAALVGIGKPKFPVICIEIEADEKPDKKKLTSELLELAQQYPHTKNIKHVLYHPSFPVDIRHNAKIFREKLTLWAGARDL